jgi:hypothetical protein
MPQYNVEVVHYSSGVPQVHRNTIHVSSASYIENHQDVVWLNNHQYKEIFKKVRSKDQNNKLSSIIRISYNGRSIRRRYKCDLQNVPLNNDDLGLTSEATRILFDSNPASSNQVIATKGNLFDTIMFYWNHPNDGNRMSFKIGFSALILSMISIIASF